MRSTVTPSGRSVRQSSSASSKRWQTGHVNEKNTATSTSPVPSGRSSAVYGSVLPNPKL